MLKGPSRKTLSFWDRQCQERQVVAIGGSDAHGAMFRWGPFRFVPLPYAKTLSSINVHLLLDRPLSDSFLKAKEQIYTALRRGRLFIAHEKVAPARGFRFYQMGEGRTRLDMGETASFQRGYLAVNVPLKGDIRIIKDGNLLGRWKGNTVSCQVKEKGVYRVEIYRHIPFFGWRPWIFSNPIYLR